MADALHGFHDLGDYFAATAEDDLTTGGDVIEQVVEVGAGLSAGDGSLAAGADTDGRTEAGPVAGGLGGAAGDQDGGDAAGGLAARFEGVVVGEGPGLVEQGCGSGEEDRWSRPLPPAPSRAPIARRALGTRCKGKGSFLLCVRVKVFDCGVEGVGQGVDRALVFAGDGAAVQLLQAREGGDVQAKTGPNVWLISSAIKEWVNAVGCSLSKNRYEPALGLTVPL